MKIGIGCDAPAYELKLQIVNMLQENGHDVVDVGCHSSEAVDYPDYARLVAQGVADGAYERGVLICGTGQGMTISANKVRGVRAALCHDVLPAVMSRNHNDSNVLCMGAWMITFETAARVVTSWLMAGFSGGPHQARLRKIAEMELSEHGSEDDRSQ